MSAKPKEKSAHVRQLERLVFQIMTESEELNADAADEAVSNMTVKELERYVKDAEE
jgi:hypothetical protein